MKLTRQQLTRIIKEELQAVLGEQEMTPEEKLAAKCKEDSEHTDFLASTAELGENFCLGVASKKFEESRNTEAGDIEKEVIRRVIKNLGFNAISELLSQDKLVLMSRSELMGFNPRETYLTHQDLEAIFKMFNPPEHEREEDEDLGGVMTTFVDQSKQRAQMLTMLAKFPTQKLKVKRGSSVDEVRFREDDFGGQMPKNIEFSN